MQNPNFEVASNLLKIRQRVAMARRSSVRGDSVHTKTVVGLVRFEVGKFRTSYDVPFRPYIFEYIHLCMSKLVWVKSDSKLENLAAATTSLTDLTFLNLE